MKEIIRTQGNVLAVVSDKRLPNDEPDVISVSDYYPYGMLMPDRSYDAEEYRYGFQNQETEFEITNAPTHSFFKYRISDNRLGRFFSVDPLFQKYTWNSSYAFSENRVIDGVEMEGLEYKSAAKWANDNLLGFPTKERGWYYSFNRYRKEETLAEIRQVSGLVCYESCLVSYARAHGLVADYLQKNNIPLNRADAINFFKKGGKHHSFIDSDFNIVDAGDILFKGKPDYNSGHAAIVASKPVFSEDGNSFVLTTYSVYAGDNYDEFNKKTYTFTKQEDGKWVDEYNQELVGFGRVDEEGIKKAFTIDEHAEINMDNKEEKE